ncbi:MAG: metallophosphoesterase [Candidatus Kapaibacterium sp.]
MLTSFFPQIFTIVALAALWLLIAIWLVTLNRQWWAIHGVRRALWITPLVGGVVVAVWALGSAARLGWLISISSGISAVVLTLTIALAVSLPFSGGVLTIERLVRWIIAKRKKNQITTAPLIVDSNITSPNLPGSAPDRGRRSFVTGAAVTIPAVTFASAGFGLLSSHGAVRMPEMEMRFPDLHPALEGLRILHLSDIHIGNYVDLDDLEKIMDAAQSTRPDLVLVSGDISDDVAMLPDALRLIAGLKTKYGTFASLGNHEYFRGIQQIVRIIDAGPIPLLRSSGTSIAIGGGALYIGGADDPVMMGQRERNHAFLQRSVRAAFDGAPSDAFHLLMSHRPEGLDVAVEERIPFTVAGHTHGAQVGFNGRSVLEPWMPKNYLWGHYRKDGSQLYTSSGVGHWFPFRLGCPPEAPLYVLRKDAGMG